MRARGRGVRMQAGTLPPPGAWNAWSGGNGIGGTAPGCAGTWGCAAGALGAQRGQLDQKPEQGCHGAGPAALGLHGVCACVCVCSFASQLRGVGRGLGRGLVCLGREVGGEVEPHLGWLGPP